MYLSRLRSSTEAFTGTNRQAAKMAEICCRIEAAESMPNLADLARHTNLSQYHFYPVFKRIIGQTPKTYAATHRDQQFRDKLAKSRTIIEAIYEAGYNASSRL